MGTFWAMQKVNEEPLGHRDQSSSMSGAAPNPWVAPSLILSHANPGEGYTHPLSIDKSLINHLEEGYSMSLLIVRTNRTIWFKAQQDS